MTSDEPALTHPRHQLDDVLLTPVRFSAMAALRSEVGIDFATLRALIETENSTLSKAITHVQRAGYVLARKGYVANKPRTRVKATPEGILALAKNSEALNAIATGTPANRN